MNDNDGALELLRQQGCRRDVGAHIFVFAFAATDRAVQSVKEDAPLPRRAEEREEY
jgi:hypothetical protein